MRMTYKEDELIRLAFAEKAANWFDQHPEHWTYTDGDIEAGCLFAMRYGLGNNCVVVFKLDSNFEPINYQEII